MNEAKSDTAAAETETPPPGAAEAPSHAEILTVADERRQRLRYLLISLVILVVDQISKWMIEAHLVEHKTLNLIPGLLNFVHVRNTGVAFGLFPAHGDVRGTLVLAGLGLFALSFVLYYFWTTPLRDRPLLLALSLIIGGAIGNLIDRVANGGVTDFIDFHFQGYHWHTFNIADSAITIGIGLMILSSLRPVRAPEQPSIEAPPASAAG